MFKHEKILFHPVEIEKPNPQYAVLLQEQLGGGNGELKAAMQYMSQSFRIQDPEIRDLFLDIAAALSKLAPFTSGYPIPETGARYYLCQGGACHAPMTTLAEVRDLLKSRSASSGTRPPQGS